MIGKHTEKAQKIQELEKVIERKDIEIHDIKRSLSIVLQTIRDLNESNNYGNSDAIKRKISEIATNAIYELETDIKNELVNDFDSNY